MMAKVQNGENIAKRFNALSRAHEQAETIDDRRICNSKKAKLYADHSTTEIRTSCSWSNTSFW